MPWPSLWTRSTDTNDTSTTILPTSTPAQQSPITRLSTSYTQTLSSLTSLPPQHPLITILLPSAALTTSTLLGIKLYKSRLRRIPTPAHIPPHFFRRRSLYGYVTSVGDGDNFRFFHAPGGRWAGWGWAPGRRSFLPPAATGPEGGHKQERGGSREKVDTLHVRLSGIDAPELAHFGRPAQPFGAEALEHLRGLVLHRWVRVTLYRRDQYERVVGSAFVRSRPPLLLAPLIGALEGAGRGVVRVVLGPVEVVLRVLGWGWNAVLGKSRTDISLDMLRAGMATVYEAKFGAEFGGKEIEAQYREAEAKAKAEKKGLWAGGKGSLGASEGEAGKEGGGLWAWVKGLLGGRKAEDGGIESPREYKNRMKDLEAGKGKK